MAKLNNIRAIQKMLAGEHRMQTRTTVGWRSKKDTKKIRDVGEVWEETLPNGNVVIWEQMKGYKRRRMKNLSSLYVLREELEKYPNCYDDCEKKNNKKRYTKKDQFFRNTHGMCLDCLTKKETQLKAEGKWEEYQKKKEYEATLDWIKDMEIEKEKMKDFVDKIEYVKESGRTEKWVYENKDQVKEDIEKEFLEFKEKLLKPFQDG